MPSFLSIDTFVQLATTHILHPFPFLLLSLSFLALGYPLISFTSNTITIPFPSAVPLCIIICGFLLSIGYVSRLDAHVAAAGATRTLNWEDEIVLITGGLGGLGGLLAEIYAMRGVPVAIADVRELDREHVSQLDGKGIRYWRCDVGKREEIEQMALEMRQEVGSFGFLAHGRLILALRNIADSEILKQIPHVVAVRCWPTTSRARKLTTCEA